MSDDDLIVTVPNYPGFRARFERDDSPQPPEFYAGCPTYRVEYRDYYRVEHVYGQEEDELAEALARFLNMQSEMGRRGSVGFGDGGYDTFDRYLRIFHGGNAQTLSSQYDRGGPTYVTFITRSIWEDDWENTGDVPKAEADEWQAYIDGDVYGIVVEESTAVLTIKVNTSGAERREVSVEWEEIESCWGFYGEPDSEYLQDRAREMIADASP